MIKDINKKLDKLNKTIIKTNIVYSKIKNVLLIYL